MKQISRQKAVSNLAITTVGHPFASIGMGEQLRSSVASLNAAGLRTDIYDIFRYAGRQDQAHIDLMRDREVEHLNDGGIRIFHLNGDEVDEAISKLEQRGEEFSRGYNIVLPAWELPNYPKVWISRLQKFDEVWAISKYVQAILQRSHIPAYYVGQSVEVNAQYLYPRKFFSIKDSAFVLLQFFDTTSFPERKNPFAAVEVFKRLKQERPYADIQLVLKTKSGEEGSKGWAEFVRQHVPDVHIIDRRLDTIELHSLIAASDCLVSLHRAEGFGRGTGEAMSLGVLAMGTGWSGNLDYMTSENSLLVNSKLVPVADGQYPHWRNQKWAECDVEHALQLIKRALDDPEHANAIRLRGRATVRSMMNHRAVGLRMAEHIERIRCAGRRGARRATQ